MGTKEKLVKKIKSKPKHFSWNELLTLLKSLGYQEFKGGKTSGSVTRFLRKDSPPIIIHKPHPRPELKLYQIKQIVETLEEEGLI